MNDSTDTATIAERALHLHRCVAGACLVKTAADMPRDSMKDMAVVLV